MGKIDSSCPAASRNFPTQTRLELAAETADHLPVCMGYVDAERTYRYVNARYRELFGLPLSQIIGQQVEKVVGRDNYLAVKSYISKALDGHECEFEKYVTYPGRGERRAHFRYVPHTSEAGDALGYFILVSDVTELHEANQSLREHEHRIRLIANNVPVMISYQDADGRYRFVNRVYIEWFRLSQNEIIGRHWSEIVGAANVRMLRPRVARALQGERVEFEDDLLLPDGKLHHMRAIFVPHIEDGRVKGVFALREDITELHETIEALKVHNELMTLLADSFPAVICYVDSEERFQFANRAHAEWFGLKANGVIGKKLRQVLDPEFYEALEPKVRRVLSGERVQFEDRLQHPTDGERYSQVVYVPHADGDEVKGFFLLRTDVTALKKAEADMRHFAAHDPLTGLPNRRLLEDRYTHALPVADRNLNALCVLLMDLDGFKKINDQWGHNAGDHTLITVANRLQELCRASDTVARLGGDEFVVLMETGASKEGGVILAEKIAESISAPIPFLGHSLQVGVSIGVAMVDRTATGIDAVLQMADAAMYVAKRSGANYRVFTPTRADLDVA